ncbi:MAG TPA: AraC family transcriptional regulator, partial [Steroidobacteraceae bacterium]|nr:AraC family transcriptional regulator [Steroidobacteraceae bacterium]
ESFEVSIAEQSGSYGAIVVRPATQRKVFAQNAQFVNFTLDPRDPYFRLFRAIPDPGLLRLDRSRFVPFDAALQAAYCGRLSMDDAARLYENIVETAARFLPKPKPIDARTRQAMELLRLDPLISLEELADAVGLSYDRMSHFFSESVGLPLRSYQLWQKLHTVTSLLASGRTLTACAHAAGFTDSAHLSRTFLHVYGASPSYFLDPAKVTIFSERGVNQHRHSRRIPPRNPGLVSPVSHATAT